MGVTDLLRFRSFPRVIRRYCLPCEVFELLKRYVVRLHRCPAGKNELFGVFTEWRRSCSWKANERGLWNWTV